MEKLMPDTDYQVDAYLKYVNDFFGPQWAQSALFENVHHKDKEEVAVAFAVAVSHLYRADNYRIFPVAKTKEYWEQARKGCCGAFDSQVKCRSNRIYWIGCNYGH